MAGPDLANEANVTAPEFCLFDWEDWGLAPRGLDAAGPEQSPVLPERLVVYLVSQGFGQHA
ncbi:hypothetical protein [Streptomyces mirabilis]|uniref:hypothetical protein n=1 Tax=Streptomyces mirabilis TaxID=68239 RepID=UPI00094220C2|nr:hypothetical protein [Streptomyces mirabilis]